MMEVKVRHDMVPVLPAMGPNGTCPACGDAHLLPLGTVFPGMHVLGRYRCGACGITFLRDLPVGHAVSHPVTLGADGAPLGSDRPPVWLVEPLVEAFARPAEGEVRIERRVYREARRVVVLNTLDFLYGHVLLKLYNALHYIDRHPDLGLVVILPRMYAWLIPDGCAEAWIVDLGLGRLQGWYPAIDRFVQERIATYDEVHLARAYSHPDVSGLDLGRFTRVAPFPVERFDELPPHVTFVARQDRLWYRGPVWRFMHRVVRRLGLAGVPGRFFPADQDRLMRRTMALLRRQVPGVTFSVVGLGRATRWGAGVEDLRTQRMDTATETAWCRAYARSQVTVGVHGSNMLLPTALCAGCVEIMPRERLENLAQDISVRYADRLQLFMYRFVDEYAGPRDVARQVASMFRDHRHYRRNNLENIL
jgi:hypothetical protein